MGSAPALHPGPARLDRLRPQVSGHSVSGRLQHHAAPRLDSGDEADGAGDAPAHPHVAPRAGGGADAPLGGPPARHGGLADSALQSRPARGARPRVARHALRDNPDRYCRLSAEFLDRAAGTVRDLRVGAGRPPGARLRTARFAHRADIGHDSAPALLRSSTGRPRGRACSHGIAARSAHRSGAVRRRGVHRHGQDRAPPEQSGERDATDPALRSQ